MKKITETTENYYNDEGKLVKQIKTIIEEENASIPITYPYYPNYPQQPWYTTEITCNTASCK